MEVFRLLKEDILQESLTVTERQLYSGYPMHWHEFYEIEYVLEGEAEFVINDTSYTATKNTLCFVTPVDFQSIKVKKAPLKVINIMFDGGCVAEEISNVINSPIMMNNYPKTKIDMLYSEYKMRRSLRAFSCRQALNLILADICTKQGKKGEPIRSHFIRDEQIYLQKHFFDDITLEQAAARAGFSPNYFSRLFHSETGKTFSKYLSDLRISHAALLAEYTNYNVSDICGQCGFKSTAHFMRLFKKTYNMTVLEFRKNSRTERKKVMRNGKTKALTFSFDDGIAQDAQ